MIIERLLMATLLIVAGMGMYLLFRYWHMQRLNRLTTVAVTRPTLLYFRSDDCPSCPTQARYLDQLTRSWHGRVTIENIDANAEPETAASYGIFTLPTTVLVDEGGAVRQVNYGVTHTNKLMQQIKVMNDV